MLKKILIICLVLFEFLFAFSFSIDKPSCHIVTKRGSKQSYTITVKNSNKIPISVKVYAMDWVYVKGNNAKQFLKAGSSKSSCAKWIKISQPKFTVAANSKKEFQFKIETPKSAVGGNQAVIFFETDLAQKGSGGVSYGARLGSVIYQETKDHSTVKLDIIDKKVSAGTNKVYYKLKVKNSGNSWNSASAIISLVKSGEVVTQETLGPVNLLPGESHEFKGMFEKPGSEVLITIEDSKENLLTDRVEISDAI